MARPALPDDTVAAIVRDFQGEDSLEAIGARHGVSVRQIYVIAHRRGLRRRTTDRADRAGTCALSTAESLLFDFVSRLARRAAELPSNVDIGEELGYSAESIRFGLRGLCAKGLIRIDGVHPNRRLTLCATGDATAPVPDVLLPAAPERRILSASPCFWCGARLDACDCGRSAW